jgi:integrase/recombinase XerD
MTARHRNQLFESNRKPACNILSKNVARRGWSGRDAALYSRSSERKYVNLSERALLIAEIRDAPPEWRLFILMLVWSGARISEVLALTPSAIQLEQGIVAFTTLKRREFVVREIPLPDWLLVELEKHFLIRERQRTKVQAGARLWKFHRVTGWRYLKAKMAAAGISGVRASPRGLRHAFGVATLAAGLPLNTVQHLLGHSSIETTTIYTAAMGQEQREIVSRFWYCTDGGPRTRDC